MRSKLRLKLLKEPDHFNITDEVTRTASSVAEEISRFLDRPDIFVNVAAERIERALDFYEDLVAQIAAKSVPNPKGPSYTLRGREAHRNYELKTYTGYGTGCDICGGGFDTPTFMSLRIGSWKARLFIDLCRPCAKRLSSCVDARLEDGRRKYEHPANPR